MAPGAPAGAGGNIKVVVRVRPFNGREMDRNAACIVEMRDNQTVLTPPPDHAGPAKGNKDTSQKVFAFDRSYWSFNKDDPNYAGQSNLHEDLGLPLLDNAFQGYNNCIFAYGQTGSGKSYSMMGYGKEIGIIPQICQDMFKRIGEMQSDPNLKCTVEVSYLEIYNERVRDLLNPATKGNLKVREHPSTGPYVEDLAKLVVGSFQEIEHLMDEGNKARTVAATNMNETSSRSHAVFTLMLTQKKFDVETKMEMEKVAKISLVDLAGSERATSTGATGARLKEGAEINRSLSTLGRVIAALADLSTGKKKKGGASTQVPYRDSVLTWLLKDSLGGNSMTAMIAAISPADINYDETLSTLRYADSAKRIKNHAVINEDANARMIRELKEELALLRSKLGGGGPGGAGGANVPPDEVYAEGTPLEKQLVSITQADGTVKRVSKAEIAEQLSQSEKLLTDLNQTWEQKLAKTEEIHKEREAALEELGISIEKGFIGLSTPKKMPHLVNLSDDPLLAECLVYNLKPGTTTVGNVDSPTEHQANIQLNGSRILQDHCTFENAPDGTVTVVPMPDAAVMVNGKRITEPKQLHSGYRVILGDFHIFRFNHPMEARAERAEIRAEQGQSLLRQSITASQLQSLDRMSPSPSPRGMGHGHDRSISKAGSDFGGFSDSRPESPAPFSRSGRDSDWSFARREAAGAILGTDRNVASLTDDELNTLFEEVQRARAERVTTGREGDEDMESMSSYPIREKYMSTGTIDNFSLDTALTMPSTPKQGEVDDKLREVREELQIQLEKQKEEYQDQLKTAEAANVEVEEIKKEKERMVDALQTLKVEMQKQLDVQRQQFEEKMEKMDPLKRPKAKPKLSPEEIELAKKVTKHWRSRHYVQMAEEVLQHAATLKEAQIMSHELGENVFFQFAVVDVGHSIFSSYDMVLNDLEEGEDPALEQAQKPCVGVRLIDYKYNVVRLWSLEKLYERIRQMRLLHQFLDQPEYGDPVDMASPFIESHMPAYTLIGDVDVPLKTVFESRVQDFSLDVISPYTGHAIGIMKLALEPSSARAPPSMLKFNVVMHEMIGFPEREGTEVHAQLFIPGISEDDGITTTQMIDDFDEDPIRFESVHSMSVPIAGPQDATLRVAVFAKVSSMHLDKLLSWDDMRDAALPTRESGPQAARIAESHFFTEERHDVLSRIQILEMNEEGAYVPVEVAQLNELDPGTFQLHQGIQRRIAINVSHSSGDMLPWDGVSALRVGKIQLLDASGKQPDPNSVPPPDVTLKLSSAPSFRNNANGTRSITLTGQWDSSQHNSALMDRVTADKFRVQMTVWWDITSEKLAEPMKFSATFCCQILSRSFVRQPSMLSTLWQSVRFVRSSTAMFTIATRPAPIKRVGDLWRMNSQHDYVKGEENLGAWAPRGVTLVSDYISGRKKRQRILEIGAAQNALKRIGLPAPKFTPEHEARLLAESGIHSADTSDDVAVDEAARERNGEMESIEELLRDTPDASQILAAPAEPAPEAALEAVPEIEPGADDEVATPRAEPSTEPFAESNEVEPGETPTTGTETVAADEEDKALEEHRTQAGAEPEVPGPPASSYTDEEERVLHKSLKLWKKYPDPLAQLLAPENTAPPVNGVTSDSAEPPSLVTTVIRVPKNPKVMKGGYLLVPSNDATRWIKRFVELRRPYLHIHNVTDGDEVGLVSLRNARVESEPGILGLLESRHPDYRHNGFDIQDHHDYSQDESQSEQNGGYTNGGSSNGDESASEAESHRTNGTNGTSGTNGTTGTNGTDGNNGTNGSNGLTSPPPSLPPTPASKSTTPYRAGHRRTSSGRMISTIWTGSGGSVGHVGAKRRPGLQRLSDRLQAGVFAIYGTDNTWLFAARSERDKMEWIARIDQSFLMPASSVSSSMANTRSASPNIAAGVVAAVGAFIGSKMGPTGQNADG
ncbi:kinesin group protein [Sporothrix schenckii 1099-18]|uniref:Kinesin group protein n=1 Tax=Sporothrix schenckii 1099-18 TaxID=1397361 RepID=A0A0F2MHS6_SPOSC|nr:kinesin group protein [Sporothrix schenckii 1099-18]KJR89177.1 kinesin group protein [Sporothrix schenckii 1099-18]